MTLRCDQNVFIITNCTVCNYRQMLHIASVYEEHFLYIVNVLVHCGTKGDKLLTTADTAIKMILSSAT